MIISRACGENFNERNERIKHILCISKVSFLLPKSECNACDAWLLIHIKFSISGVTSATEVVL